MDLHKFFNPAWRPWWLAILLPIATAGVAGTLHAAPSEVHIFNSVAFGPASTLEVELAGPSAGPPTEYDRLIVHGTATLGGTLDVLLINGFETQISTFHQFTIVEAESLLGGFANVLPGERVTVEEFNLSLQVDYGAASPFDPNHVVLSNLLFNPVLATWVGGNDGWTTAANWDINEVPNNASPNFYDVAVPAGTANIDAAIEIEALAIDGGTVQNTGSLTVHASTSITSGSLNASAGGTTDLLGITTLAGSGTIGVDGDEAVLHIHAPLEASDTSSLVVQNGATVDWLATSSAITDGSSLLVSGAGSRMQGNTTISLGGDDENAPPRVEVFGGAVIAPTSPGDAIEFVTAGDNTVAEIVVDGTGSLYDTGSASLTLASAAGSTATLQVTGGGVVVVGDSLNVAAAPGATGAIEILDGTATSSSGAIGVVTGSNGMVIVEGSGSAWMNGGALRVGDDGTGTLQVAGGGTVESNTASIAFSTGSMGEVTVSGPDATWTNSGDLYVGGNASLAGGDGVLSVGSGGTVNVGATLTIWDQGTVNLLGGTIIADDLAMPGSTFNFTLGTLRLTSDQTLAAAGDLAKAIGDSPVLTAGKHLAIDGIATLLTPVTLDGGTLSVGDLANASLLDLKKGAFHLTQADLTIGAGGLFGDTLALAVEQAVHVASDATVASGGVLSIAPGGQFSAGTLLNQGDIALGGVTARLVTSSATLTNEGVISGTGRIEGTLVNTASGEVRVEVGQTLTFTGPSADNSGDVRLLGGIVDFHGPLTNTAGGRITGRGVLIARDGLDNQAHVALSSGITDVHGDVTNDTGDAAVGITVSGNADATFWGDVTNTSGLFRVSANSSAAFFGSFAGAGISGPGDVYFEADITPGSSPGLAEFGGNVHFGPLVNLEIELAGTTKGSQYDSLAIAGTAALDGTLTVPLLDGFMPSAGDVFEIITAAGGIAGMFADAMLPALTDDLFWNIDYGTNAVTLAVAAPGLSGDFNLDGTVDAADYVLWRKSPGDFGGDPDGYNTWRTNFGITIRNGSAAASSLQTAVPEPSSILLLLLAATFALCRFPRTLGWYHAENLNAI